MNRTKKKRYSPTITVLSRARKIRINKTAVHAIAAAMATGESISYDEIQILFCTNPAIRKLKRAFFGIDAPTDVIAFPGTSDIAACLAVSYDMALNRHKDFGTTPGEELALYLIHGLLHLAGYTDTSAKGSSTMRHKEKHWSLALKHEIDRILLPSFSSHPV